MKKIIGRECKAIVTGKPVGKGGSKGRKKATGFGVSRIVLKLLEKNNIDKSETSVGVQGFGNVGSNTCLSLYEEGIKVVSIAEYIDGINYAIFDEEGLNIPELIKFRKNEKDLRKIPGIKVIEVDDFWSLKVDFLIPAAMEAAVDSRVASLINAKIIVEAANGLLLSEADKIFEERNIPVIPDILANTGGVIVSYFEWVQNLNKESWDEEDVLKKTEDKLFDAFSSLWTFKKDKGISTFRQASYILAIEKIINTTNSDSAL